MMRILQAGVASLALIALSAPSKAADLGGSIKDYGSPPIYAAPAAVGGASCYFRSSAGYSWSRDPSVQWTGTTFANETMGNSWLGEGAIGCGSASDRGLRGELALGMRGSKSFKADLTSFPVTVTNATRPPVVVDSGSAGSRGTRRSQTAPDSDVPCGLTMRVSCPGPGARE